jgi:holo-[acyl-carrier protein] synthase
VIVGIGVDAVELHRVAEALERTPGLRRRLYSDAELRYADQATGPRGPVERLAVRFAAKEAVVKALGVGIFAIDHHDVEVVRAGSGAPTLRIAGRAAALAAERGVTDWHLSLTHTEHTAMAVVVAESRA